ncbi:MAG: archaellin/type IV pilin N-terminal domain-containing protein [Nanoarchaeota archaeon]
MKSKKAISGVITAVIMIALVIAATSIVWTIVNNLVKDKLDEAGSCFDTFEKVTINNKYTCYNITEESSTDPNELRVSISVSDIDLTALLVSVSDSQGNSKSFKLSNTPITENYLRLYNGNYNEDIIIPEKNSGINYVINTQELGIGYPSLIQLAPIVGGKQCEVSDLLSKIDNCKSLVF